jgi:hypothetical protein
MKGTNLKSEIETVLEELGTKGYTRTDIEKELDYSDNYIDQQLSKGGNQRFLNSLKSLNSRVLQKAIFGKATSVTKPETTTNPEPKLTNVDIQKLIDSNYMMAQAMLEAEKNRTLIAQSNSDLVRVVTGGGQRQNSQDDDARRYAALQILFEVAAGKQWPTKEDAAEAYRTKIADVLEHIEEGGILQNSDK